MTDATTWRIAEGDYVRHRSLGTMDGLFNRMMLVFTNAETGEVDHVTSTDEESASRVGIFERLVKAQHRTLTREAAQATVELLGLGARGWRAHPQHPQRRWVFRERDPFNGPGRSHGPVSLT